MDVNVYRVYLVFDVVVGIGPGSGFFLIARVFEITATFLLLLLLLLFLLLWLFPLLMSSDRNKNTAFH